MVGGAHPFGWIVSLLRNARCVRVVKKFFPEKSTTCTQVRRSYCYKVYERYPAFWVMKPRRTHLISKVWPEYVQCGCDLMYLFRSPLFLQCWMWENRCHLCHWLHMESAKNWGNLVCLFPATVNLFFSSSHPYAHMLSRSFFFFFFLENSWGF